MAAITITAALVDASKQAMIERGILGVAASAGQLLYKHTDGTWLLADADAEASSKTRGVLLGSGVLGTSYPIGAQVDIVVHGRITWGEGMTIGADVYTSVTAGAGDQTAPAVAGDFPFKIGWAWSATELFVQPQMATPVVVP
jgi:hypothetical protein